MGNWWKHFTQSVDDNKQKSFERPQGLSTFINNFDDPENTLTTSEMTQSWQGYQYVEEQSWDSKRAQMGWNTELKWKEQER